MKCRECGADILAQRDGKSKRSGLCSSCGRRLRLASYFRQYYLGHRDTILAKNRRWADENKDRVAELRRVRAAARPRPPREPAYCIDCSAEVVRAERCRRCYVRHKYGTDPAYRQRRLETTRRWAERQRALLRKPEEPAHANAGMAAS